jgi:hypothetical protein
MAVTCVACLRPGSRGAGMQRKRNRSEHLPRYPGQDQSLRSESSSAKEAVGSDLGPFLREYRRLRCRLAFASLLSWLRPASIRRDVSPHNQYLSHAGPLRGAQKEKAHFVPRCIRDVRLAAKRMRKQ